MAMDVLSGVHAVMYVLALEVMKFTIAFCVFIIGMGVWRIRKEKKRWPTAVELAPIMMRGAVPLCALTTVTGIAGAQTQWSNGGPPVFNGIFLLQIFLGLVAIAVMKHAYELLAKLNGD